MSPSPAMALCSCGDRFSDHSFQEFSYGECLIEKENGFCPCKTYDGKGPVLPAAKQNSRIWRRSKVLNQKPGGHTDE